MPDGHGDEVVDAVRMPGREHPGHHSAEVVADDWRALGQTLACRPKGLSGLAGFGQAPDRKGCSSGSKASISSRSY